MSGDRAARLDLLLRVDAHNSAAVDDWTVDGRRLTLAEIHLLSGITDDELEQVAAMRLDAVNAGWRAEIDDERGRPADDAARRGRRTETHRDV